MEFKEWFIARLNEAEINPTNFAGLIKENQPTIQRIISGETKNPGIKLVAKIESYFGKSYSLANESSNSIKEPPLQYKTHITIKRLNVQASMGDGIIKNESDLIIESMTLLRASIKNQLKNIHPDDMAFIHAMGDSMLPTFNDGDLLLINRAHINVDIDGVYVLEAQERLFIKRVRRRLDGQYEVSSDNPAFKTIDTLDGSNTVTVHGRVIWVWNGKKL